ncbi:MAG: hypothetical protein J6T27_00185 [Alphaproteobacteria bacterium]|nr:hypothetical protein [Alphaproteobacteria bacterium]
MKGKILSFTICALCAFSALSAVRTQNSPARAITTETNRTGQTVAARTATNTRTATNRATNARIGTARVARTGRASANPRGAITTAAMGRIASRAATNRTATARGATTQTISTNTFDEKYHNCYAAYFSCMDQFCATIDDHYRRCICSSKLDTVKTRENALSQTSTQLQDFKDLNIDAILKTPAEVKAMLTASEGETKLAGTRDNSASNKKLTAIGDVLKKAKTNSLSTAGTLDIAGDIGQIWNTTDIVSGANISNLTGEPLYNAVHAQCAELVMPTCTSMTTLNMVASAYGMYIENDCAILLTALEKQSINANAAIRETNREMNAARLENYDAHNSTAINECIAGVRADVTADTACGANYIHCLDLTGLYLDRATGNPIYSKNFYKLNDQISLSGNILTNSINAKLVTELNSKRKFAEHTLETCRDIADTVWEEYLRQAITEIYQGQQSRIQQVKNECMDVVNKCYDAKTQQLRDYSNIEEQMLLGSRLELSEQMCSEKLETCSNLYGGGANGLERLVTEMRNIVNQKIAQNCLGTLKEYAKKLCRVPTSDTTHEYPYGCRVYTPGDIEYADNPYCNYVSSSTYTGAPIIPTDNDYINTFIGTEPPNGYACWKNRIYQRCKSGFYLETYNDKDKCLKCPPEEDGWECDGIHPPRKTGVDCGTDYAGSLYQKMVTYAMQYCVRPSDSSAQDSVLPIGVLADVNTVMDSLRSDMATILARECIDMGGTWTNDINADKYMDFYNETNANEKWGVCTVQ